MAQFSQMLELPIQEVEKSDANVLKANSERFVDDSFLRELESTDFINRVAAQYGLK